MLFFHSLVFLSWFLILTCLVCCSIGWQEKGNIDTTLDLTSHNEFLEELICVRPNYMKMVSILCFACQISDASLQRLRSITLPRGLFLSPPFPRCTQDVHIASPLIQAVSADCFLFEHKSHRLILNCRCLSFPAGERSIVAFIKSQELCIFKINECAVLNANNMWDHNFVWLFF